MDAQQRVKRYNYMQLLSDITRLENELKEKQEQMRRLEAEIEWISWDS